MAVYSRCIFALRNGRNSLNTSYSWQAFESQLNNGRNALGLVNEACLCFLLNLFILLASGPVWSKPKTSLWTWHVASSLMIVSRRPGTGPNTYWQMHAVIWTNISIITTWSAQDSIWMSVKLDFRWYPHWIHQDLSMNNLDLYKQVTLTLSQVKYASKDTHKWGYPLQPNIFGWAAQYHTS